MNHKNTVFNLEELKRKELHKVKEMQQTIAKIEASISYHKSMYLLNEKKSTEAIKVLSGYSRENVRDIIKFLIDALKNSTAYFEFYKDIDLESLIDNNDFFDFVIVEIGAPTIKEIKSKFDKVEIHNGELLMRTQNQAKTTDNTRNRLWKKLTKKSITTEAKRILSEGE